MTFSVVAFHRHSDFGMSLSPRTAFHLLIHPSFMENIRRAFRMQLEHPVLCLLGDLILSLLCAHRSLGLFFNRIYHALWYLLISVSAIVY